MGTATANVPVASAAEERATRLEADAAGIAFHYDLPPEFFRLFLDPTLSYSCHYFLTPAETLARAALNKLELVARKLDLRREDRVLDVGCGWGSFLLWAAARHGCHATGITLSPRQAAYVRQEADARGLGALVDVHVMHANEMTFAAGSFDKIVTIGAIEHIADLDGLWRDCARLLRGGPDARMLVHGMTVPPAARRPGRPEGQLSGEASFIQEYIFPVGAMTHLHEVIRTLEVNDLEVIDVEPITDHYTRTLQGWLDNLLANADETAPPPGVPPERLRAQLLFLAGCVEAFSEGRIFCYQTLVRPVTIGPPRRPLPPTRHAYLLAPGAANETGAPR